MSNVKISVRRAVLTHLTFSLHSEMNIGVWPKAAIVFTLHTNDVEPYSSSCRAEYEHIIVCRSDRVAATLSLLTCACERNEKRATTTTTTTTRCDAMRRGRERTWDACLSHIKTPFYAQAQRAYASVYLLATEADER